VSGATVLKAGISLAFDCGSALAFFSSFFFGSGLATCLTSSFFSFSIPN